MIKGILSSKSTRIRMMIQEYSRVKDLRVWCVQMYILMDERRPVQHKLHYIIHNISHNQQTSIRAQKKFVTLTSEDFNRILRCPQLQYSLRVFENSRPRGIVENVFVIAVPTLLFTRFWFRKCNVSRAGPFVYLQGVLATWVKTQQNYSHHMTKCVRLLMCLS